MTRFVSLLRAINVGGQKTIRMADLRYLYEELGYSRVQTYLQSGNVVCESGGHDLTSAAGLIEGGIDTRYGFRVEVFLRQVGELEHLLGQNPFVHAGREDPAKLHVTFLYQEPAADAWNSLAVPPGIEDEFQRSAGALYLFCPNGYGRTRLSNSFFERKLHMPVTTRNWNTVAALYRMVSG